MYLTLQRQRAICYVEHENLLCVCGSEPEFNLVHQINRAMIVCSLPTIGPSIVIYLVNWSLSFHYLIIPLILILTDAYKTS